MSTLAFDDTPRARDALRERLAQVGFAVLAPTTSSLTPEKLRGDPWSVVETLFDVEARMAERQPIRPVAGATSFAAGTGDAPLHTDSQPFDGVPAHVQLMACRAPASRGGVSLLVDAFAVAEQLAVRDPGLFSDLIGVRRTLRFYFGTFQVPSLSVVDGELFFTHPPVARDAIGDRLARALPPPLRVAVRAGEVLVVDNHRMLHGRDAFDDARRSFERVLAWLPSPLAADHPLRARVGLAAASPRAVDVRERAVLALLRGVPPGVVARRYGVAEEELYALRARAVAGLRGAL